MAKKEFQRKYMHPTRRKLVDMVFNGEYDKNTQVSFSDIKTPKKRKIGDIWEDEHGNVWEQRDFGKIKKSKMTDVLSEVRNYLKEQLRCKYEGCDVKGKYSRADLKIIAKTGYCAGCLARKETQIKEDGLWTEYNNFIAYTNALAEGNDIIQKLNQALHEVTNIDKFANEDGSIEEWVGGKDVEVVKQDIQSEIDRINNEIEVVTKKRNEVYEILKDKNYEMVKKH